jgi:hypothetical protein
MENEYKIPDVAELEQEEPEVVEKLQNQIQPNKDLPTATTVPEKPETDTAYKTPEWLKPFRGGLPGEERGVLGSVMDALAAPSAGLNDYVVDELNKLPFVNMRKQSKFTNEAVQATRELSSLLIPFIGMRRTAMKGGAALQAKVKHPLGEKRLMKYFSEMGIDTGVGAYVDYTNKLNEYDDNFSGWLKKNWPKTWAFIPSDWATIDGESPDMFRAKNIMEGVRFGFLGSVLESSVKLGRALKNLNNVTSFVFENESAAKKFAPKVEPTDPTDVAENMAAHAQKYEEALDEMGQLNLSKNPNPEVPMPGVHDAFDDVQVATLPVDDMGIVGASVDAVRIADNQGTIHGRLRNMVSEPAMEVGLQGDNLANRSIVNALKDELQSAGNYSVKLPDGTKYNMARISDEGSRLAEALIDPRMEPGSIKELFKDYNDIYNRMGNQIGALGDVGVDAAKKALKKYTDDFVNMDAVKAQAYFVSSLAGQVSDIAEGARMIDEFDAVARAKDRILDRMQYIISETMFAKKMRNQTTRALGEIVRRRDSPESILEAAKAANLSAKEAAQESADYATNFRNTLQEVAEKRPEMFKVLMEAYEVTDGSIDTMHKLNTFVWEKLGAINKYVWDEKPGISNEIVQGLRGNIYNAMLTSTYAPVAAGVGNGVLLAEKPIATFVGAALGGDLATIRRGWYMYSAVFESYTKALKHGGKMFWKASKNTSPMDATTRQDFITKSDSELSLLKSFADAAAVGGDEGALAMYHIAEALHGLSYNPILRAGPNSMIGLDGLASSALANAEARAAAYDAWTASGKKIDAAAMKQIQDDVYNRTWDANGKLVDEKVAYQTAEIALNLDSDNVRAFNNLLNKNPWLKTHLLFPRSLASAMTGFGERSPITLFMNDYRKLVMGGGYEKFSQEEIAAIMTPRGLPPTKVEFDKLRAEMRGRVALGTVAIYKAVDLWMNGRLRGDGNSDAARQRTRNQMGWKAGTVQTNDGDWVDISWLGPHGQWLKLIATYMDNFFDDIDPVSGENFFGKMMFVFASGFTNQSMYASVEPLMDTLEGNGVAMARWAANYTSNLAPLSKIRQQIGDTMYPGLRIMENNFQSYFLNRNKFLPGGKEMPHMHDWLEGQKVGYPENPFVRFWNANFPMKIYDGEISPQRQYIMDVGWDSRPIFEKGENGVEYTNDEQAALYEQFGKDRFFFDDVTDIMNRVPSQTYLQSMREQRANGMQVDASLWYDVHRDLNAAARKAKKLALASLDPSMLTEIRLREAAEADRQRRQRQGVADPKEGYNAVTMTNN